MSVTIDSTVGSNGVEKQQFSAYDADLDELYANCGLSADEVLPEDVPSGVGVEGGIETLFDEDGSLVPAERLSARVSDEPETAEEWLDAAAPERLSKIDEKTAGGSTTFLGMERSELIEFHIQKAIEAAEAAGRSVLPETVETVPEFEIRLEQVPSEDKFKGVDLDPGGDSHIAEACPLCGAEAVLTWTRLVQTRSADEPETRVTSYGCGCTERSD